MAFEAGGGRRGLKAEVERLSARSRDPNLRAQFTGFAAIHGQGGLINPSGRLARSTSRRTASIGCAAALARDA